MRIEEWFQIARKREIQPPLAQPYSGIQVDLGAGEAGEPGLDPLDLEHGWNADTDAIPYGDDEVNYIRMHGFIDYVEQPVDVLRECARVLVVGGHIDLVVPHAMAELGSSDIHKKTRWTEESFKHLLDNEHYTPEGADLPFEIHTQFIIGIVWRNLSLFTQLVRI